MITISPLNQNLILKIYVINLDFQKIKLLKISLIYFIFLILEVLTIFQRHPVTSQIRICILIHHKRLIEMPEPKLFYEHN